VAGKTSADRQYDIVLFGATGFTGRLTAEYLAGHTPESTRWALAGRSLEGLEEVRSRLTGLNRACKDLPLLQADVTDPGSIRAVAESARVVVTTVGPYVKYGEPLVAACAEAGTDYLDLTGEPEFVDRMYVAYHEKACETGARIIHAAGFDSVPHDLGAYFTVQRLPEGVPIRVEGFVRASTSPSGGTVESVITAFSRGRQNLQAARRRRAVEPRPDGRRVRISRGMALFAPPSGAWTVPMPSIDPEIVARSARALDRYGPDFTYGHYFATRRLAVLAGAVAGLGAVLAMAQLPPTRALLLRLRRAGEGPSPEVRARSWFNVRFVGEGGGRRVVTEVSGGDPGYDEAAKILSEAALCLAHDDLPATAGQVTTVQAMGDALIGRLGRAGIPFRVLKESTV
jgi:short subunit dehydrogenase-like uncharacterized protein